MEGITSKLPKISIYDIPKTAQQLYVIADQECSGVYISIGVEEHKPGSAKETININNHINLDLNDKGELIGIEVY